MSNSNQHITHTRKVIGWYEYSNSYSDSVVTTCAIVIKKKEEKNDC